MNPRVRERVRTVVFMVALTAAVMAVVTAIQLATAGLVERNRTAFLKRAVMEAAGLQTPADDAEMLSLFDRLVAAEPAGVPEPVFYRVRGTPDGPVAALVFKRAGVGLWGRMTAVIGLDAAARGVLGMVFTDQNETPGLGARIVEPWFRGQFRGKTPPFRLVPEGQSAAAGEVNAITGATITTRGVAEMIEKLLAEAPGLARGGSG
jgi:Na+-transporting NADH:ubiquinone oxidoreductase subunit C